MRLLLNLDRMSELTEIEGRQQITPGMRFTCDGIITKWILGVEVQDSLLNPEIQVWRKFSNNDTYYKINGSRINNIVENRGRNKRMIVYETFQPIPIKPGDVLGFFGPQSQDSRFVLLSEETDSPSNYYLPAGNARNSVYSVMDIHSSTPLQQNYRPLVSVEVGMINFNFLLAYLIFFNHYRKNY